MRKLLFLPLIAACAQADPEPPNPPLVEEPSFVAESGPAPSLRLQGAFDERGLAVEIWADDLGPIFGVAGGLVFDPEHLDVESADLAPNLLPDSAELIRVDASRVVFGVARKGASLGDAMLDGAVRLATVHFAIKGGGDSELRISRAMVRHSDGAFVPAAFLGAAVHTVGGTP